MLLITQSNPDFNAGSHLEMDLPSLPPASPTADLLRKVWRAAREALEVRGPLGFTPLWNNPRYPGLNKLEGFALWKRKGIWFFPQIYTGTVLKSFAQLCAEFTLPTRCFYQYLQLRHALQAQGQTISLTTASSPLLMELLQAKARNGQISKVYSVLLSSIQDHVSLKCRTKWMNDIIEIDGDQWHWNQSLWFPSQPSIGFHSYLSCT